MLAQNYDIITVGGGIAASALAKAMAEQGARVLVLERETYIPSSGASAPLQHTKTTKKKPAATAFPMPRGRSTPRLAPKTSAD